MDEMPDFCRYGCYWDCEHRTFGLRVDFTDEAKEAIRKAARNHLDTIPIMQRIAWDWARPYTNWQLVQRYVGGTWR